MDETSLSDPVGISPKNIYGLRKEVRGNIHISYNDEVIYPCESVIVFHNFNTKKQRFLRLPVNTVPTVMTMNLTRKLIAVVEITTPEGKKKSTNISIYDTTNLKKRRNFQLPNDHEKKEINKIEFSHDSRSLLVLTKKPGETLFMMMFDKNGTILEHVVGVQSSRMSATCVAGNPHDTGLIAVCGDGILKLFSKSETGFTLNGSIRAQLSVKSMAWMSMDVLALGCDKNKLAIIENGEVKSQHIATELELLDLSLEQDDEELDEETPFVGRATIALPETIDSVLCVRSQSRSLAYAVDDKVYFFEKVSKYEYQRTAIITLQKYMYTDNVFAIRNMAVNSQQDTVIVTAEHSQIYVCYLKEDREIIKMRFKPLGEFIHIDEIIDISVCAWRTIIMTASKDQTVRVWNYETENLELVKRYQVDITVTELNITGQFAAIGFADQLRVMTILLDDLNLMKAYNFPRCAQVKYSCLGHLMAAAYESLISITAVYNMEIVRTLKGHNGNVLSLAWSRDDKYLISGGAEGAIYQWDVDTGERVQEIVQKGTEYRGLCITGDPMSTIAITGSGLLREITKSEVTRELSSPNKDPFLSLALARSDEVMFATTNAGHLYNITVPFDTGGTFTNYRFFDSPVTKVCLSYDGTLLITGSKKGTLGIWILTNIDGKVAPLDRDLLNGKEVVIPREVLQEKIDLIANLELRIVQQAAEFQYQESQNEIFDSQQLADVHKGYCLAIEALKNRNNELEQRHTEDLNDLTFRMNDLKNEYGKQILNLSNQFTERMLKEYQTYMSVSRNSKLIIEDYEAKLRTSAGQLQDTVEALEVNFKTKLEQKEELIRDLMQELQDVKYEFNDYCHQVAIENQKNVKDTIIKYENMLKAELDEEILWRGKAGVLNRKATNIKKEAERLLEEINLLNEEDVKSQLIISKLVLDKENLLKNVADCEFAISLKEKRIQEILHKNQELEKHKQVLNHKITELKLQIEPRERQINEKRDQIIKVENELDTLNRENLELEAQLAHLTDTYKKTVLDLEDQRIVSRTSRENLFKVCTDLYHVAASITNQKQMEQGVRELIQKYASDDQLKKKIVLESLVKAEFNRQRGNIESTILDCKRKISRKEKAKDKGELLNENVTLMKEIEVVKAEGAKCMKDINFVMNCLKIPDQKSPQTQQRLAHTLKEIETERLKHEELIEDLESQLHFLTSSIEELRRESRDLDREALAHHLHQHQ